MAKVRIIVFLITIVVVGTVLYVASLYARGYRFNPQTLKFIPNGLLIIKSVPDGAQLFINGEFKTATNTTLPLPPGTYDIRVEKEGFWTWSKRMTIEKEIVTEATAHLFKIAPSLSAITFSGTLNPTPSRDFTKIAYVVPAGVNGFENQNNPRLWVVEMLNLPLGFSREPKGITDGDLADASWIWSPDGREILLTTPQGVFLLNSGTFTPQSERINVISKKEAILTSWNEELKKRREAQIAKLPDELEDILRRKTSSFVLSPDEDMVLYTASASATIPTNIVKQLPGASTQKQERNLKVGGSYVYDIKEDRNFLIVEDSNDLTIDGGTQSQAKRRLGWFSTSRHLVLAENDKITILDYDGTNRQTVYAGVYFSPNAFSTLSIDRLLILTNLGAYTATPNLYSLGLK
ncbi:hypothetical protein A2962_01180 [Candidatus Woesebacteria bacterium RIFCSPLOWO2_01_FULL_39_61]|nr:MAG: hypothetical protein A2692_00555 [Candidatus Woesebacteria bacterium RIFCSPHIGHO2_01_FULL_39_95]OGM36292.1 MAG: hypothetical protein A3E13_03610 [Candidatus Woesebacteria bacterium RIFCSPHIGHO2_12_FULL_40_20]OGM66279.1 MAG: hypothetical protein A2962_01180 [Candidatus Woesebacteria bacterium RIFCSPLOWO2_01_FULL_39_61]